MKAPISVAFLAFAACLLLPAPSSRATSNLDVARQLNQAFADVVEKASPTVVLVSARENPVVWPDEPDAGGGTNSANTLLREFGGVQPQPFDQGWPDENQGSGVILRADGYILTSRHVVDNAAQIEVRLLDGRTFKAVVRGTDVLSDLAVLKIEANRLPVARFADSSKVRVGEFAIAIGAPFNYDHSVTFGHISAKGRSNIIPPIEGGGSMDQDFIQTDANINPGSSGGPLLNIEGEVVGINTMIRGLHTGIGFAVPSNFAKEISDKLIADGKFTRAWLGIEIRAVKDLLDDPEFTEATKGIDHGVLVRAIRPDGPAVNSELRAGDVITAVDGKAIDGVQQLRNEVRAKPLNRDLTLSVFRAGKTIQVKIKPAEYSSAAAHPATGGRFNPADPLSALGMTVHTLSRAVAERFGVKLTEGVIVLEVDPAGPAGRKGIKPGDIISAINEQAVTSPKSFFDAVKKGDLKQGVAVKVVSGDSVRVEMLKEGND